jgi:4-amino-4-deoxy-L-arabinose transferase-like glycosyltransferase
VPRALSALLVVVGLMGVSWALLTPAWQSPDEDVHFAYVQTLAELHRLPGGKGGPVSSAQIHAEQALNNDPVVFFATARPERSRAAYDQYLRRAPTYDQRDGGGPNTASYYPPAYYLLAAVGYDLAGSSDVVTHLYAARMFSVVCLLLTVVGVWLLAGELFDRRRDLQLVAAGVVGLWPMIDFMSASVNPDSLLYATWSFALWLGVRVLRRGIDVGSGAALGLVVALAMVTKATSVALLPAVAFVVLFSAVRLGRKEPKLAVLAGLACLVLFALPVEGWRLTAAGLGRGGYGQVGGVASAGLNVKEFLSYVWQYYLPRLSFQQPIHLDTGYVSSYPAFNVWVASSWAAFGWVTVFFPVWIYKYFLWITVAFGAAAGLKVVSWFFKSRRDPGQWLRWLPTLTFFALATAVLVLGLHLTEYRLHGPVNQGRYLFPIAGIFGCAVALAVTVVPARFRGWLVGGVLGGVVAYQFLCIGFVASHYYA